jgi:coproporphyrinogen III oxidase
MRSIWLLRAKSAAWLGRGSWRSIVVGNIFNSQGIHVAVVVGTEIFDLMGRKLYNLKGSNIYRPSGELVGHMNDTTGSDKRLAHSTDRLFPGHH